MQPDGSIRLTDGRSLDVSVWRYPISWSDQAVVIELWRTEWDETGFDWLSWMCGVHASAIVTETVVVWNESVAVATATVCYPARQPELCIIMNVVTRKAWRGLGIGSQLTDLAVNRAFRAGCMSAYLGNTPTPRSAYEKCGFVRLAGVFMRKTRPESPDPEVSLFAAGQHTAVRSADWGDIPSYAALVAQPLDTLVLDYPRGLVSAKYLAPERGLTQFSSVWYGSRRAGGDMQVLVGDTAHRVLGFGSFTPASGSTRNWLADVDFVCHGHYVKDAPALLRSLIDAAKAKQHVQVLRLHTADTDTLKRECARNCGFGAPDETTEELRLGEKRIALQVQKLVL